MTHSLDFAIFAYHNDEFKKKILDCLESDTACEVCTDAQRITFDPIEKTVEARALSADSPFSSKTPPIVISYQELRHYINGELDQLK